MRQQIEKLKKLGFNVKEEMDAIIVTKGEWHITFLNAGDKLVTFSGKIRKDKLAERTLFEYSKYYKDELKRFFLNLFGKVNMRISDKMKSIIRTDYADFIFSGKKLLDIKNVKDYEKVAKILTDYQNMLKGE